MERLAEQLEDDLNELIPCTSQIEQERIDRAIRRLAAYEDTGLTPDEVRAYKDAEEQGLVVRLPESRKPLIGLEKEDTREAAENLCREVLQGYQGVISTSPTIDSFHAAGGCYCRECEKFARYTKNNLILGICKQHNAEVNENDFCSYGKLREGEGHEA